MKTKSILISLTVAALCAAETFAAPMGTAFTYQGRLNDGGQPANNLYDLTFTLHDDPVNVASVGTYIILSAVPVTNGLFTVQLNAGGEFGPNAFTGQARWLQIGVRTNSINDIFNNFTFLAPRQPLTPAPYALFASNAMTAVNASYAASVADGAVTGLKLAPGAVTWAGITGIPAGFADGVDNDSAYSAGAGLNLSGANQFSVNFVGSGIANTAARSDHGHFGANWNGNSSGFGLVVANNSTSGTGLYAQQGTGSGSSVPFGFKAAVWGESSHGDAIYGACGSAFGAGVYGHATHPTGANYGVYGASDSPLGNGLFGIASSAIGTNNHGVFGLCQSTNGGHGVLGRLSYGSTRTDKHWYPAGVFGEAHSGVGVAGFSDEYFGVTGHSTHSTGVSGLSDEGAGVDGISGSGAGVSATSLQGNPIEAYSWGGLFLLTRVFRVAGSGDVFAKGTFHPGGADFAEMLPAQSSLEPGDVLVIGEDGKLARSTQPYQENVAGVHATKPGLLGGAHDGADLTGKSPLAVVGIVPVKVTNENGPIKPGDKLTTSSTPGHAMKAGKHAEIGTVIGKALQPLRSERGVIEILVILQ